MKIKHRIFSATTTFCVAIFLLNIFYAEVAHASTGVNQILNRSYKGGAASVMGDTLKVGIVFSDLISPSNTFSDVHITLDFDEYDLTSNSFIKTTQRSCGSFAGAGGGSNSYGSGYPLMECSYQIQSGDYASQVKVSSITGTIYDLQGNVVMLSLDGIDTIVHDMSVDAAPPVIELFSLPATSSTADVPVTLSVHDYGQTGSLFLEKYCIGESAAAPTSVYDSRCSSTPISTYHFTSTGQKTLYAWVYDRFENSSSVSSASVDLNVADATAPRIGSLSLNNSMYGSRSWWNYQLPLRLVASDDYAVAAWQILETATNTAPDAPSSNWTALGTDSAASVDLSINPYPTANGSRYFWAFVKDVAGNVSLVSTGLNVNIDIITPRVTSFAVSQNPAANVVDVTDFTVSDVYNGGGTFEYLITEGSFLPATANWTTTKPTSYTFTTAGQKTLYAWVRDAAWNTSQSITATVTVTQIPDVTKPVVNSFYCQQKGTSPLTATITSIGATDDIGVTGYFINDTGIPPATSELGWSTTIPTEYPFAVPNPNNGTVGLYAWARDAAGNVSSLNIDNWPSGNMCILWDATFPVVNTFTIPATSVSLTVDNITIIASDAFGVAGYALTESASSNGATWTTTAPTSYTFATAGAKTLYAWAKDTGGRISSASVSASVTITLSDTTAPTVTAFTIPSAASSLTVDVASFTAADTVGVSGYALTETVTSSGATWTATAPTSYTFATAGAKTLYAWAKDAAGNISTSKSASVTITLTDTTTPTVGTFSIPVTSSSLTVSSIVLTATDNIAVTGYALTESTTSAGASWRTTAPTSYTFATAGTKTLYAWAKDAAGNISTSKSASVTITLTDTTAPTISTFSVPVASSSLTVSPIVLTATDNTAVAEYALTETATSTGATWTTTAPTSYTFATAGAKTLYAWAKDAAGNISIGTVSRSVTITLPSTTLGASFNSFTTTDSSPMISGTYTGSPTSIKLALNGQTYSATIYNNNTWALIDNVINPALNNGVYNVGVTATDITGKTATSYATLTIGTGSSTVTNTVTNTSSDDGGHSSSKKKSTVAKRTLKNSRNIVSRGMILTQSGKNFSKNARILLYFQSGKKGYYAPKAVVADSKGRFAVSYKVNKPAGVYNWYAEDTKTGKKVWSKYRVR